VKINEIWGEPYPANIGNPHIVFFVTFDPGQKIPEIDYFGNLIQKHPLFEHNRGVNVSVAQIKNRKSIKLQVWERGVGLTDACGTAACATLAVAVSKGLTNRKASVEMPGGVLDMEFKNDNHMWMTGPVEEEFRGTIAL
jgi:diaminopimelate epimerase